MCLSLVLQVADALERLPQSSIDGMPDTDTRMRAHGAVVVDQGCEKVQEDRLKVRPVEYSNVPEEDEVDQTMEIIRDDFGRRDLGGIDPLPHAVVTS